MVASTSYRTVALLACCQALLLTNAAGLIAMSALVGYALAPEKSLATLGATTYVIGSALATMPASLWMARVGRRRGFMTAALVNVVGCAVALGSLLAGSFALFCFATALIGIYNAFGQQYRFAAAEVATPRDRPKAISLVLAGGIVGGFLGPASTVLARDWIASVPFGGSFLLLALYSLVALAVQSRVDVPKPVIPHDSPAARPLGAIARQPVFITAVLSGALGYGLMSLLMVATPLAMSFCSHPYAQAALVIQWHVVGMFAPGFVTGHLIARFGAPKVIVAGVLLMALCAVVALSGNAVAHFLVALVLLGVGWNFMYTAATALLGEAHGPQEKAKVQGANELAVFATQALASLGSGALIAGAGWERMNLAALPVLAVVLAAVAWLAWQRRAPKPQAA